MTIVPPFDADLLRRYDRPGPRYTSYPTAPRFAAGFDDTRFREVARLSNQDPIPRALSLYAHIPFCFSPCFYCGCNRVITRDKARGGAYLARLVREIALVAPLFDRDREVVQLHLGGGTPNFLAAGELAELMETFQRHFHFAPAARRDFSIELDPRHVGPADVDALAFMGFNRASLGVQDFDPDVQIAVNRIQGVDETLAVIEACRRNGFRSVNVDLIYGLPRQTPEGFGRTLEIVVGARPDRLAIYGYAHLPAMFKGQRQIPDELLPRPEEKLALLQLAIERLTEAGYRYIGMDHFALPADELSLAQESGTLHRNFMGYTTHAETDLVGVGASAISHVGDSFSQNPRDLPAWEAAIDAGRLPTWRGMDLDADDVLRAELIQQLMCNGAIDKPALEGRHHVAFDAYFEAEMARLPPLVADGLVELTPTAIRATSRGRLLLRIIAACFDRYLHEAPPEPAQYSRAI